MHSLKLLSAIAAFTGAAVAASDSCKDVKITTTNPQIDCEVVSGDVTVSKSVAGNLVINGPKQIKGDLIIKDAQQLLGVSSPSINSIGGTFTLENLNLLSSLQMSSLRTLNKIAFIKLLRLSTLTFGSDGVTRANSVRISDTFLSDLSGLSLATVDDFQIDNNPKLTRFMSDLTNITGTFISSDNGQNFVVNMSQLESANNLQFGAIKSFNAPALADVSTLRFTSNPELKSFFAPNLTKVADSLSFDQNNKLTNISFPKLTEIDGDLTIVNNTAFTNMTGLSKLQKVGGAIVLGGAFKEVELPALKDVIGSVKVTSTTDISKFCDTFDKFKSDSVIRGDESCTSKNPNAQAGGDGGEESDGSSSSSSDSSSNDQDSAAGMTRMNLALFALAAVAGVAQMM